MPRPEPRLLTVMESRRLTPNMHRVTIGGTGMEGFPTEQDGGYVKLMIEDEHGRRVRTYTIRHHHTDRLDIDFALHGEDAESGPATRWAVTAAVGDTIHVGGPGAAKPLPDTAGPFLIAGDMTALPAIAVNLERARRDATGTAFIAIRDEADRQRIAAPDGVTIHWLVDPKLGEHPAMLIDAVRGAPFPDDLSYAWAACEFESMKGLRDYLRKERGLGPDRLYLSSYWKRGLIEDEHKTVKRSDTEANG
ncbi:siderophore-interacting protein [Croceicoccus hydrothermalis]|uniref:siderophore-interacting protein n=1 Tax=Croceicoccus hydrothermalis TaxID=2867964 RepID=UPI001EFC06D6|nr:siderophore-interacting protein [Croceicoccus hydrothermalis]